MNDIEDRATSVEQITDRCGAIPLVVLVSSVLGVEQIVTALKRLEARQQVVQELDVVAT
jgi:hypothetical protein